MEIAHSSDDYAMLTGDGPAIGFGRVEGYRAPAWPNPNGSKQYHLDVAATDIAEAEATAVGLGATVADPQPGETWRVLLDPAGHPFCLTDARQLGLRLGPRAGQGRVTSRSESSRRADGLPGAGVKQTSSGPSPIGASVG